MSFALFDTLSGTSRLLPASPIGETFGVYVCGPTVYDHAHLGHARCYVVYDVLIRHLRSIGTNVKYVRNITDIDDKIVKRAAETGTTPDELTKTFTKSFHEDMASLGNLSPDVEPTVSGHLAEIIALITQLIENRSAYQSGSDVYFRVRSSKDYGKLSRRPIEALKEGASGRTKDEEAQRKEDPADFALWKGATDSGWSFESPWGKGRPGWHIECSAMALKHIGKTVDLHGGGLDLVFPHHENEIAQSEAATGQTFCNHWMHNGFVEVNKEKMGKSLGNFFMLKDVLGTYSAEAVRLGLLTVHYRSPLNLDPHGEAATEVVRAILWKGPTVTGVKFTVFEDAERRLEYLYTTLLRRAEFAEGSSVAAEVPPLGVNITSALNDDLNTPIALAHLSEFLAAANGLMDKAKSKKFLAKATLDALDGGFEALRSQLGLGGADPVSVLTAVRSARAERRGIAPQDVEKLVQERLEARARKDFAAADSIRDTLQAMGVELMDGNQFAWRVTA